MIYQVLDIWGHAPQSDGVRALSDTLILRVDEDLSIPFVGFHREPSPAARLYKLVAAPFQGLALPVQSAQVHADVTDSRVFPVGKAFQVKNSNCHQAHTLNDTTIDIKIQLAVSLVYKLRANPRKRELQRVLGSLATVKQHKEHDQDGIRNNPPGCIFARPDRHGPQNLTPIGITRQRVRRGLESRRTSRYRRADGGSGIDERDSYGYRRLFHRAGRAGGTLESLALRRGVVFFNYDRGDHATGRGLIFSLYPNSLALRVGRGHLWTESRLGKVNKARESKANGRVLSI